MNAAWLDEYTESSARVCNALQLERRGHQHKLEKRLCRDIGRAIVNFNMIKNGNKAMVCVSGGKDRHAMLDILLELRKRTPTTFSLMAVNLEQKQPGLSQHIRPTYLEQLGVPFHIENQATCSAVKGVIPARKTLCSRLQRGSLCRSAGKLGAAKIARGHHRRRVLQTFFSASFFCGQAQAYAA